MCIELGKTAILRLGITSENRQYFYWKRVLVETISLWNKCKSFTVMKRLKLMKLQKQTQFNVKLDFPSCLELIPLRRKATTLVRFFRGFYLLIIELRTTQAKVTWHFSKWNLVLCYMNNIFLILRLVRTYS